ncbi:hypothetical protein GCM10025867_01930 [Frondihabitans sucicola]|uniref:Uncharacterized protein n=1 Tax=Frondihabitans sucicola TaxID=1268041 RepID=A0ABM8GIE6_9MICO|nr:hypothetical protein [Frondihabitans sucicola]BDZ47952.1 hypothetical protein GCM10025867_01930 [Frondihabitans sucicola]
MPFRGTGHWQNAAAADPVADVLRSARVGRPDGPAVIELRQVQTDVALRDGAMTSLPGPVPVHAVGLAEGPDRRAAVERALPGVDSVVVVAVVGLGRAAVSFRERASAVGDAYPARLAPEDRRDRSGAGSCRSFRFRARASRMR